LEEIRKLLIDMQADVNVQRYVDGMNPMDHFAASDSRRRNRSELRKAIFLWRQGASLSLRSASGLLPVDLIASSRLKVKFASSDALSDNDPLA